MPALPPERVSFADFCKRRDLSPRLVAGFRADLTGAGVASFNYHTEAEWEQQLELFMQADRRRRTHHG